MAEAAAIDRSGDTRETILVAALQAFAQKGFDGTSTRDIVTRAGVNHGLIRYYFGTKAKLWQAAVDRAFSKLSAGATAVLQDTEVADERDKLRRLLSNHVHFVAENPEFVQLMHEEGKQRGPRMRWIVDRHVKPLYEMLSALLSRIGSAGVLGPNVSPIHFFYVFAGAVGVIYHQAEECKRISGVDPFTQESIEEHVRILEALFLGPSEEEIPQ